MVQSPCGGGCATLRALDRAGIVYERVDGPAVIDSNTNTKK